MAEIIVRLATADDTDALTELWLALVDYHRALDPDLPPAARGGEHRYVRRIVDRLDDPYTRTLVAECDGQVIGFALGMIVDLMADIFAQSPTGFLADIFVQPEYRRNGAGQRMVDALLTWFRHCGVFHFEWQVAARNAPGIAFWQSFGGRPLMIRMHAPIGDPP